MQKQGNGWDGGGEGGGAVKQSLLLKEVLVRLWPSRLTCCQPAVLVGLGSCTAVILQSSAFGDGKSTSQMCSWLSQGHLCCLIQDCSCQPCSRRHAEAPECLPRLSLGKGCRGFFCPGWDLGHAGGFEHFTGSSWLQAASLG